MKGNGLARLGIGAALLAAPAVLGRPWIGASADEPGGQVALRALGVRDALLGGMAIHVAGAQDPMVAARWSAAIAACDLVDGAATLAARRHLPERAGGVVALALGAAALGLGVAARLRSEA
jgi:hypothetical protein